MTIPAKKKDKKMSTYTNSANFVARPVDSRCRYIAVVAEVATLPSPSKIEGLKCVGGSTVRGDVELYDSQIIIESEEAHHRKQRGFTWAGYVVREGVVRRIPENNLELKSLIRGTQLLSAADKKDLLGGKGEAAHFVRWVKAEALGLVGLESLPKPEKEMAATVSA